MDQQYSDAPAADTTPLGTELATLVADKLEAGDSIGYSHRDYCGMGIETNAKGQFLYGELWDSGMETPTVFANKADFITWLSGQSNASLARLDDDPFFRGNQVITRERLLAFLQEWSGSLDD